jgi:hypothetical protein
VAAPPPGVETAPPTPSAAELPPRSVPRPARVATASRAEPEASSPAWQRERSTASWMVREYGRSYAESRARAAAAFYDARSPEGAYWRRVLAEIVAADR